MATILTNSRLLHEAASDLEHFNRQVKRQPDWHRSSFQEPEMETVRQSISEEPARIAHSLNHTDMRGGGGKELYSSDPKRSLQHAPLTLELLNRKIEALPSYHIIIACWSNDGLWVRVCMDTPGIITNDSLVIEAYVVTGLNREHIINRKMYVTLTGAPLQVPEEVIEETHRLARQAKDIKSILAL